MLMLHVVRVRVCDTKRQLKLTRLERSDDDNDNDNDLFHETGSSTHKRTQLFILPQHNRCQGSVRSTRIEPFTENALMIIESIDAYRKLGMCV